MVGKKLEQPSDFATAPQQRQYDNGGNAKGAAGFEIHARIGFRVITTQKLPAGNALAGQSRADLKARAGELTKSQLVGLRFASDGELAGLVTRCLNGELKNGEAVKKEIQTWVPDTLRA